MAWGGYFNSYCKTQCGKHYLFGNNTNNQCITSGTNDHRSTVDTPHCINDVIESHCGKGQIKLVALGCDNTTVMISK